MAASLPLSGFRCDPKGDRVLHVFRFPVSWCSSAAGAANQHPEIGPSLLALAAEHLFSRHASWCYLRHHASALVEAGKMRL